MITFESIKNEFKKEEEFKEEYSLFQKTLFKLVTKVTTKFEKDTGLEAKNFYRKIVQTEYLSKYCKSIDQTWVKFNFQISPGTWFKQPITIFGTVSISDSIYDLEISSDHLKVNVNHLRLLRESIENTLNKYFPE